MKSKHLLIMLLIALMAPWAAMAQETLTVYDQGGTNTNNYVPIYGLYCDEGVKCEFVIPSDELEDMANGTISAMKFYLKSVGSNTISPTFTIFMKEVDFTTMTALTGTSGATTVFNNSITFTKNTSDVEVDIPFSENYTYEGGNLLIGIYQNAALGSGNYTSTYWYGENQTYNSAWSGSGSGSARQFLPKTTFTYEAASGGDPCKKPQLSSNVTTTATEATLTWTEKGDATSWTLQYGTDSNFGTGTYTEASTGFSVVGTTVTAEIDGLTPLRQYYARVKPGCDTDGTHWSGTVSFTTLAQAVAVGDSWSDDFEGESCGWELINGAVTQANWCWGTAVNNGGTHSIYVSNDNGATNSYNPSGYAKVFATKLLTFADNKYTFQFDWKCVGESTYDYLRVGLIPATTQLTADNNSSQDNPTGWIALHDTDKLSGQSTWTTSPEKTVQLSAGNYYLVLRWRQDNSTSNGAPAAVDNVSITKLACPYDVTGLAVATDPAPTAHTATINWTAGDAEQWQVEWSTSNSFPAASTSSQIVDEPTIDLEDLESSSTYYVRVRAYCGGTDYGVACTPVSFNTACEAITTFPWEEDFENYATGDFSAPCWSNTIVSGSYKFRVSTSSNGTNSTHQLYAASTNNSVAKLVFPEMTIPTGKTYQFIVDLYRSSSYSSYDDGIRVYASTDGNLTDATELGFLYRYYSKTDNGVVTSETTYGWYTYTFDIPFDGSCFIILQGEGKGGSNTYVDNLIVRQAPDCATPEGLALTTGSQTPEGATITWTAGDASSWIVEYKKSTEENYTVIAEPVNAATYTFTGLDASTTYNVRVKVNCTTGEGVTFPTDPVSFTTQQGCPAPTNLVVTGITASQAVLTWTPGYNETEWTVKYKKNGSTDEYTTAPTVSGTPTITLTGLDGATSYAVQIYGCDATHVYTVSNAFTTAYSSPFEEKFAASSIPTAWNNYSMLLSDDVLNGTTPLSGSGSGSWGFSNTNVFGEYHAKLNIYGTGCKSWLVTPNITVGAGYSLGFDLALTDYGSTSAIEFPEGQADDKFIVLISEDNGTTWTILRQWNNTGSEYVYNEIAPGGESVYIDLAAYSGKTVRVAFYGESTVSVTGEDNDLHIDNVSIDVTPTCYKPGKPAASNVTNHSATLTWTAGEEGQTAWQIAWKKGEDFNPNAAGFDLSTVDVEDVEALTYTFDKTLDAASTYYVYVRANCGSEYSKWCSNACSFTTKVELPAPTSLTVANVMPTSLDLGWTVGGGDFEESWDIIYATSSTTPAADATPNFAGVTQNPYPVSGLTNNTTYYFWVRANHTGYGTSAWSSYKYQKTPEACPKPTALTAGDPTPNSIKLSWTAGTTWQTSWIVAYSETSDFNPTDETACSYVEADTNVFVVDELEDDKTYYFRVKGNCGSEYGESAWNTTQASAKTLVACPKPTNLAANNLTLTTADLTWTGYSDSYTVQIREGVPTYLSEDFEDGSMPEGWSRTGNYWSVGSGTGSTSYTGAANGNYNATCYINKGYSTSDMLITPAMDLSSSQGATLSFNYWNVAWGNDINQFHVYYRVNNGEWQQLYEDLAAQSSWTTTPITIALVGLADKYQIGFECKTGSGSTAYGYGMGIDDVKVYETSATPGEWEDATTEATNGAYTLTGLTAGVTYDVQIEGNCEGAVPSDVLTFTLPEFLAKEIVAHGENDGDPGWYLIASPLAGAINPATVGMITDDHGAEATPANASYDLYYFDQTNETEWKNYRNSVFSLEPGMGYLYANKNNVTLKFSGTPYSGTGEVTLSYSTDNPNEDMHGWNLIGNPLSTPASIGSTPYYRMNYTENAAGKQVGGNRIIADDGNIAPMEGVFVHAEGEDESVTFTKATRAASDDAKLVLNLSQNSKVVDRAIVRFSEARQLPKFQLNPNHTKVYVPQDGKDYAVVYSEGSGAMPVNFKAEENGSYTINFTNQEVTFNYLHLIDNMTGNDIDLLQTPSYSFEARTTDYESRFKLVFATGSNADSDSFAFCSNGNWIISNEGDATLQVIDINGRILSSERINGSVSKTIHGAAGVYMLRLINGEKVMVQKIVVR